MERFHFYLFGRSFDLITDHKPLEVIFGPKSRPSARIERWVLRLQSYQYQIKYRAGKSNIADPLSRLSVGKSLGKPFDEESEHYVNLIATTSAPVAIKLITIKEASRDDDETQAIKTAIYKNQWPDEYAQYKMFESELCFAGDILLRGTRIVIPSALRPKVIELAHEGHPGATVMKRRLRAKVWWPKIDQQVEKYVKNCRGCTLVSAPAAPEPLRRRELPSAPWQHIAIDFLGPLPSGHNLLVVVDYYSRYKEIEVMKKVDATATIQRLRAMFARFGLPISITADNGPTFTSNEFVQYCETNNILLVHTAPYWPRQNGEVERQNRSILKRLIICHNSNGNWQDDLNDYLLMYRSTVHSTTMKTPAELMFGRNIRDKLPQIDQPLEIDESTYDIDKEKKERGKQYADKKRQAKESDLKEGDVVLVKRHAKTNKLSSTFDPTEHVVVGRKGAEATVESQETKKTYRRNVAHLKKIIDDAEDEEELPAKRTRRPPERFGQMND